MYKGSGYDVICEFVKSEQQRTSGPDNDQHASGACHRVIPGCTVVKSLRNNRHKHRPQKKGSTKPLAFMWLRKRGNIP